LRIGLKSGVVKQQVSLDHLRRDLAARILTVDGEHPAGERLLALGLLPGMEVALLGVAPLGDPIWIRSGGLHVAVRRADAVCVSIAYDEVRFM
jgi:Fe2+ transport system protein FeoA